MFEKESKDQTDEYFWKKVQADSILLSTFVQCLPFSIN